MKGYRKTHHVWFVREDRWYPVGVGRNQPIDIDELDNAVEIAREASKREGIKGVMVIVKETATYTSLTDAHEYQLNNYTALRDVV